LTWKTRPLIPPNFGQMFDLASHLVLVYRGAFWHVGVREGA